MRDRLNEFWPIFLGAHLDRRNQLLHCFGTVFMLTQLAVFVITGHLLFLGLAFCGYVPSWIGHGVFEKNVPPTLGNPIVAGLCELKMVGLLAAGELDAELLRLFGSTRPKRGTACRLTAEQEKDYQSVMRYRIRDEIAKHPFGEDYWKIFLMKHQTLPCVAFHVAAMLYFYGLIGTVVLSGNLRLLIAVPLTQLLGLASHAVYERSHIDFEDAIFSPRAFLCLNRMLYLFLTGRYFAQARGAAQEMELVP